MFLNLSKGQEELKALLAENTAKKSPKDNQDDQVEQLQAEIERMRIQMSSQIDLIQSLARGARRVKTPYQQTSLRRIQPYEAGSRGWEPSH